MKKNIFLVAVFLFAASISMATFFGCSEDEDDDTNESCWEIVYTYSANGGKQQQQKYYRWGTAAEINKRIDEFLKSRGGSVQSKQPTKIKKSACDDSF